MKNHHRINKFSNEPGIPLIFCEKCGKVFVKSRSVGMTTSCFNIEFVLSLIKNDPCKYSDEEFDIKDILE